MMPRPLLFAWQWQLIELAPVLVVTVLGLLPCVALARSPVSMPVLCSWAKPGSQCNNPLVCLDQQVLVIEFYYGEAHGIAAIWALLESAVVCFHSRRGSPVPGALESAAAGA